MLKLYLIQTQHLLYNGTTMESCTQIDVIPLAQLE